MGNKNSSSSAAALAACSKTTIAAVTDRETGSHVLCIPSYSKVRACGVVDRIKSGTFTVGGHRWYIAFFPDGEYVGSDCISVYVHLDQPFGANADADTARFEFKLLRQNGRPDPWFRGHSIDEPNFSNIDGPRRWGRSDFINRKAEAFQPYLMNDSLQIRCDVTVTKKTRLEATTSPSLAAPPPDLHRHLAGLLASQVGADVRFVVRGGEVFLAHRAVLAARSPVFMAELFGPLAEKAGAAACIRVDDMDAAAFRAMLHFIYTDSLPLAMTGGGKAGGDEERAMAQHLLVAADKYDLERLKVICEGKLCCCVDSKTVATTLLLAEQHGFSSLKEACVRFLMVRGNLRSLMASEEFKDVMSSCPSLVRELLAKVAP